MGKKYERLEQAVLSSKVGKWRQGTTEREWWDEEVQRKRRVLRKVRKKYQKENDEERREINKQEYRRERLNYKRLIEEKKIKKMIEIISGERELWGAV